MNIYTMGFTKKTAEEFFSLIKNNHIEILIDIRLNSNSQLSGFAKGRDLPFFLREICNCAYTHEGIFAPSKELLDSYKKGGKSWREYEVSYNELCVQREMNRFFKKMYSNFDRVLLMCSESTPNQCHRRLLAEFLEENIEDVKVIHL